MTLDVRLQALMRRRGIKSQSQLARLAGVSQSSIHRILLATPGYMPTRAILIRLAHALDTSISWLSEGVAELHRPERRRGNGHADAGIDADRGPGIGLGAGVPLGPQSEWRQLFAQLPRAEREALLALARLMQQQQQQRSAVMSKTDLNRRATAPSLVSSVPAGYPPALEPYEAYPIE